MSFETWINGDVLYATPLNGNFNNAVLRSLSIAKDSSDYKNYDMSADDADVSTNISYDADTDEYVSTSGAVVLTFPSLSINLVDKKTGELLEYGIVKWNYYVATVVDECNDSSVDTNLWTGTATVGGVTLTENSTRLTAVSDQSGGIGNTVVINVKLDGVSAPDFSSGDNICVIHVQKGVSSNSDFLIKVTDGSTTVNVSSAIGINVSGIFKYVLKFDGTDCYTWKDGVMENGGAAYDLSSISGAYNIVISVTGNDDDSIPQLNVYYVRNITGSETTSIIPSFSADDGSNYVTSSDNDFYDALANKGYESKIKLNGTIVAGEVLSVTDVKWAHFTNNE